MTISRDPIWPPGEAYRSPPAELEKMPTCPRCGQAHLDPLPWCRISNRTPNDER